MQFVLASHNKKKLAELSAIVSSLGIEIIPLPEGAPEPEENGKSFEENAMIKAKSAAERNSAPAAVPFVRVYFGRYPKNY